MFELTNAKLRAVIAKYGFSAPPSVLHLYGIHSCLPVAERPGYLRLVPGKLDRYDDTIGTFGTQLTMYQGTVDPGATYTNKPMNPKGCAHLCRLDERGKPYRYVFGLHKGKPALSQGGPVIVVRDRDRDGNAESGEPRETGWFGINIHRGGTS